ncbi:MAG: SAV_6107 family HEPN domain-containing protein [Streptosporangiaceae bacterium]
MVNAAEVRTGGKFGPRHPGIPRVPGVPVAPTVLSMLQSARRGLAEATDETSPGARYVTAHLAALRAAAAVVAARGEPRTRRRKPYSVWDLLPQVEPTLTEWAAYFAAGAGKRAAAEAGLPRAVTTREADELLRDAATFVSLAESALGVAAQAPLPLSAAI